MTWKCEERRRILIKKPEERRRKGSKSRSPTSSIRSMALSGRKRSGMYLRVCMHATIRGDSGEFLLCDPHITSIRGDSGDCFCCTGGPSLTAATPRGELLWRVPMESPYGESLRRVPVESPCGESPWRIPMENPESRWRVPIESPYRESLSRVPIENPDSESLLGDGAPGRELGRGDQRTISDPHAVVRLVPDLAAARGD